MFIELLTINEDIIESDLDVITLELRQSMLNNWQRQQVEFSART